MAPKRFQTNSESLLRQPDKNRGDGPVFPARRSFLVTVSEIASSLLALFFAIPFVRFVLYPVFAKGSEAQWSDLGPVDEYAPLSSPALRFLNLQTVDGWLESASKEAVYVTKDAQGRVEVLTAICPHLGCTVEWVATDNQFKCPCHGSVYAADGARISGPAPRGMDSLPIHVEKGHLKVRYERFRQLLPTKEVSS